MKRRLILIFLMLQTLWAVGQSIEVSDVILPSITVHGVVTSSEDSLPLPQLAIRIKGTTTGVVTDADGHYSITVPSRESVLIFEYVGMETQEFQVGDRVELNVVMNPALENQLTGSSVQLKSDELNQRPNVQIVEGMAGRIPGLVANMSSSTPGSMQTVRVRGAGSIAGDSTDPLYVVDGAPIAYEKVKHFVRSKRDRVIKTSCDDSLMR